MNKLRAATIEDFNFFLEIKSEEKNMFWTKHDKKPDSNELFKWFQKQLVSEKRKILICEVDSKPVGYSYIIFDDNIIETAVAVKQNYEGNGYGRFIVEMTKQYCLDRYKKNLHAWIFKNNIVSQEIHIKAGYKKTLCTKVFENDTMELFAVERDGI